ncbi:hypothetical protein BJX63DRAFT_122025 [Aspergillus granulosus]|uniref:Uncharacterized protein n=1 Tax=Aspergillus granulosus TaxID=176169 RepID=A0ABR4I4F9_9EURO
MTESSDSMSESFTSSRRLIQGINNHRVVHALTWSLAGGSAQLVSGEAPDSSLQHLHLLFHPLGDDVTVAPVPATLFKIQSLFFPDAQCVSPHNISQVTSMLDQHNIPELARRARTLHPPSQGSRPNSRWRSDILVQSRHRKVPSQLTCRSHCASFSTKARLPYVSANHAPSLALLALTPQKDSPMINRGEYHYITVGDRDAA